MNEVQIISAYPSKSHFQRVLICAALSDELINIENYPECDDSLILINALIELGYNIELTSNKLSINSCPRKVKENYVVNCGESGFCSRVLPIIFSAENANFEFKYSTRMIERNLEPLIDILNQLKIHPILEKNSLFLHGSNNLNI